MNKTELFVFTGSYVFVLCVCVRVCVGLWQPVLPEYLTKADR